MLIRLRGYPGWSAPLLFARAKTGFLMTWLIYCFLHYYFLTALMTGVVNLHFYQTLSPIRRYMSRLMKKPTKWLCNQWRLRSAWASAQLIRVFAPISLGIRPVWSESSLCAQWVAKDRPKLSSCGQLRLVLSWGGSYEQEHDKTNKLTCTPSEDSDQAGHPQSLFPVFAVCYMGS